MTKVRLPLACLAAVVLALAVAACGSSSSGSPASTNVAATGGAGGYGGGPGGANPQRRTQITACLRKQGVTLPQRPGGAGGPGAQQSGAGPGRFADPAVRAALAKCGITPGGFGGSGAVANTPAARAQLTAFVACMRTNGVNLPAPNTSGSGPVFGAVNRNDPKFVAAFAKCRSTLGRAFGQGGQAGGG
jgi:hypothetical protein